MATASSPRYPLLRYLDYPFGIDGNGAAALTLADDHVRDLIEQVLFTAPGERVMLPEFGCGLLKLVFEPNSELLAAATELLVRGSLQRWLEYVIDVSSVRVSADEERLVVDVEYVRLVDGREVAVRIVAPGSAG
jgi:phage baseplate assembly protein W